MAPLRFGLSLAPAATELEGIRSLVRAADDAGLDLVGIQDHPYQRRFVDTFALIAALLAETRRITAFPDVGNLPLRPPAVLAKTAATLDLLSGGRFELGLGAGAFWEAIEAMGGPRRTPGESVEALAEAIEVIRLIWSGDRGVRFDGRHYRLAGVHAGPPPAHDVGIWIGAYRPRMLRLVGRLADGWVPSLGNTTREDLRDAHARIDEAAAAAGRDPAAIRRVLNLGGPIGERDGERLGGPPAFWAELVAGLAADGFDSFVFWPQGDVRAQFDAWAGEVVPAARAAAGG
jgi:alkanesulfonate monooxygenase SsuD/methylene tetrahydromethanopterin reductase-like flavin-dependent oxidoreductase (luciferase family)